MPAHFKLLSGDTRKVLDEPYQGCPGGVIADEPEEHSLFAEFGMYYKSPEIAPLAQQANPLEATTGEATTGAGAAPTGGAPAGTAMPIEDLAGAVARGAAGAAATGAARTGTASAAPAGAGAGRRPARMPRPPLARRLPTSPPRSRRAPAGAGVEDGGHPRVSSVRVLSVGVCSLLRPGA